MSSLRISLQKQFKSPNLFVFLTLIVLGFIIYSNSLESSFHFDDQIYIINNPNIRSFNNLDVTFWSNPTVFVAYLTFILNYQYAKLEVFGYHLCNTFFHIISSFLVYLFVLLTLKLNSIKDSQKNENYFPSISLFAALIFLCHPIQTQAVTYIAQRTTSLAALFYLLSITFYAKARKDDNIYFLNVASLTTAISMFTKEIAFTLPAMIAVYEFTFFGYKKETIAKRLLVLLPFLLSLLIIPTFRIMYLQIAGTDIYKNIAAETINISRTQYVLTQFNVIRTYMRLLLFPIHQNIDYNYPISNSPFEIHTALSFLLITSIIVFAFKIYKHNKLIAFGIFWFFITLSVESTIIPIKDVIFEHRLYLPMAGFSIFFSVLLTNIFGNKKYRMAILFFIVTVLSVLTIRRNHIWKTEITLWNDSVQKNPANPRALQHLANAYIQNENFLEAIPLLERALSLTKNDPVMRYLCLLNLGRIYLFTNRPEMAIEKFEECVKLNPQFSDGWAFLGLAYQRTKNYQKAIECYELSKKLNPNNPTLYEHLMKFYEETGDKPNLIMTARKLCELYKLDERSTQNIIDASLRMINKESN